MDKKLVRAVFGEVLRESRESRNLTQAELGTALNMDRAYISMLECGRKMPTLEMILRLALALRRSPGEIVGEVARRLKTNPEGLV